MNRISVGEAVSAGFKLLVRQPLAFAAWCGVVFVVYGAPQFLMMTSLAPLLQAGADGMNPSDPAVAEATATMMRYQPLSYLAYLALLLILPGAVFRAILRPDERAVLFLKVGAGELWSLLVSLVLIIGWFLGIVILMIPLLIIVGIAAAAGGVGAAGGATVLGVLVALVAMLASLWPLMRLSLAPVMAFADRTFRLPEAWRLTKGHGGRIFLVGLSVTAILILVEIAAVAVVFGVLAASGVFATGNAAQAMMQFGAPGLALAVAGWSVLIAFVYVIWLAAWADMYRQLRPQVADTFA